MKLTIAFAFLILALVSNAMIMVALSEPPNIIDFSPGEKVINDTTGVEREFEIKINQTVNVSWLINGIEVQKNESVTLASYINRSAVEGNWNITVIAENQNGTTNHTWIWNVTPKPSIMSKIMDIFQIPIQLWYIIVIILAFLAIYIIVMATALRIGRPGKYEENKKLIDNIKELKEDIEECNRKIRQKEAETEKNKRELNKTKKNYEEYENSKRNIKDFRNKCLKEIEEIRGSGEKIKEKEISDVVNLEPFREAEGEALSATLDEYWRLISSIKEVVKKKKEAYEEEYGKSSMLTKKLDESGIDVGLYKKLLKDSNVDGLKVLYSSLSYINERLEKREFNPETITKLNDTREKIERMMVDWGIKIVPSKLLDFCEKMIKDTSLPEEVYPKEKTVEAIIELVNEMYVKK